MIVSDKTMRRLLPPFAIFLWLIAAYVHTLHGQIRSVHQIAPGVFTRIGDRDARQPANTSWIEFRDFVVVIEANTPWGIRDILPEIRTTTSKPIRYVFDTHYHWDHTQGNSVMADQGVTVVCSQGCASELAVKGKTEWEQMSENADYSLAPYRLQQPSVVFGDFMAIDDGERRLELRRVGPAHTIGDAVAFLPKDGVLFTGDLCVNWRSGNNVGDRDADPRHWVQVLNDLARWEVKTVVPGHGALGTVATLRAQSAFLDDLWTQVSSGKKAGKSLEQLLKDVNLSKHGDFAADQQQNQSAIRAVFRKAAEP
jgi:glyoxylase-like metal-dependent hydrolase (beta-lactamase superfamily II)